MSPASGWLARDRVHRILLFQHSQVPEVPNPPNLPNPPSSTKAALRLLRPASEPDRLRTSLLPYTSKQRLLKHMFSVGNPTI